MPFTPTEVTPPVNRGQYVEDCPQHIEDATLPVSRALDYILDEVKNNPGLMVWAADDPRWQRFGWNLVYPNGRITWVGAHSRDLLEGGYLFKTSMGRAYAALCLQVNRDPRYEREWDSNMLLGFVLRIRASEKPPASICPSA